MGLPPGLKVAPRRFHGFWDKKDSKILALDFPACPLHERAPHRDGQTLSFILLNSFPKFFSSYLHSSFSSTSSVPPGTSASNAWLKHFKHAIARLLSRRSIAQNARHLQPFWTNLVAAQGHLQVFLLPSNFCEHLAGSLRLTLHHQSLHHHTTPLALAASLPIKVHPKPMNFRPRMSCSCSFTSCHKQSQIDRRCFWHIGKNRGHVNYLPHF